ncbi:MAG: hypothetical protein FJ217_02295 [Ignavibacteria bacterium]|nr:hypothetical protein [Ignavibacteria bacterium]
MLMEKVFAALARGEAAVPERTVLTLENTDNSILFMPGPLADSGGIGIEALSVFPSDAARGIPTI